MATREKSVKRYVVRLSAEEHERLEGLIRKGKSPARRLLKARVLLKADVLPAGEGWSDSQIIDALENSVSMVYRVRSTRGVVAMNAMPALMNGTFSPYCSVMRVFNMKPSMLRFVRRLPFANVRTAVHVQHLPGNVRCFSQINHGIHNLLNVRNASHWG